MAFRKSENYQDGSAILLSIQPRFSELIVSGEKCVEIRRTWPASPVTLVVIYESAPTKKIVAIARVSAVAKKAPRPLWEHTKDLGTGLSRTEFLKYLEGKKLGFAASLDRVNALDTPAAPGKIFSNFVAPQSFRYLTVSEADKALKFFGMKGA